MSEICSLFCFLLLFFCFRSFSFVLLRNRKKHFRRLRILMFVLCSVFLYFCPARISDFCSFRRTTRHSCIFALPIFRISWAWHFFAQGPSQIQSQLCSCWGTHPGFLQACGKIALDVIVFNLNDQRDTSG